MIRYGGLIGGIAALIAVAGFFAGLGVIAVGIAIWPPSVLFLAAFVGLGVWQWQSAKRVQRARAQLSEFDRVVVIDRRAKAHRPKQAPASSDFDPNLPSSLD